jgi:WD40 repeat protein
MEETAVALRFKSRFRFSLRTFLLLVLLAGVGGAWWLRTRYDQPIPIAATEFTAHKGMVLAIAISRRGDLLATAGDDKTIKVWTLDPPAKQPQITITGHSAQVRALAFSSDGKSLVAADQGGNVKVWDVNTGAEQKTFTAVTPHDRPFPALSPGGRFLAWIRDRGKYEIWDLSTEKQVSAGEAGMGAEDAALSPDGKTLSIAGGQVRVIDSQSNKGTSIRQNQYRHFRATAISPDGRLLAISDGNIPILDLVTGKQVGNVIAKHRWVRSIAFSQDGSMVAIGADGGKVVVQQNPAASNSVVLDSNALVLKTEDELRREDRIMELESARHAVAAAQNALDQGDYTGASKLASHSLRVLPDTVQAKEILMQAETHLRGEGWHRGQVSSLALSKDGRWLVTGGEDAKAKIWDLTTRQVHADLVGHKAWVRSVTFCEDDNVVMSASIDGVIKKWDADSGKELDTKAMQPDRLSQIALSHGGNYAAMLYGHPQQFEVWDLLMNAKIAAGRAEGHAESAALSPGGDKLAIAGGPLMAARVASGNWKDVTPGQGPRQGHYRAVAFSPDGTILAASPAHVNLLNSETFKILSTVNPKDNWVRGIALSNDNERMAVGLDDGKIIVFGVTETIEPIKIGYPKSVE